MGEFLGLGFNGSHHLGVTVALIHYGNAAGKINILFALNISDNGPFGRINIAGGTGGMTVWNHLVSKGLNVINTSHFLSFLTFCRVEHKNTTEDKA